MGCTESSEASTPAPAASKSAPKQAPSSANNNKSSNKKSSDGLVEGSATGKHFNEVYKLGKQLGEGAFSVVKEGQNRQTNESYAIKIVTKAKLSKEDEIALKDEIDVLKDFDYKHIIRLYDVFEEPQHYYMVTEKMMGGELFDRVVQKSYYNEKEARDVCLIIFSAINYCHTKKVAHRDLKPENLLLTSESDDSDIKIADFGFAKRVKGPKTLTTQCGTPGYVAAEILEGKPYDTQADMWSIGVIVYILLGGYPPFIEQNQRTLFRKIRKGQYEFHEEYWGQVSDDAKDLIRNLLVVDPDKRFTSDDALANKWIGADANTLAALDLGTNLAELKKFNAKRKFKAAVSTVMAANKMQSLGIDFMKNLD
jgi:serine/threonine protein kinase